jgi:aminoglycoside phosphotransferase (APT) family kinase protein
MPEAEVDVDVDLVRGLLADQHPDVAGLELTPAASGWDNVTFRLGESLAVRMPRREMAAVLVEHEQRWLPELAPRLPLPIPAPVRVGRPGRGYPWSWSVCPWLPGEPAATRPPDDPFATAEQLGAFLRALQVAAPAGAPVNPYRGGPLADRAPALRDRVEQLADLIDGPRVLDLWADALAAPGWDEPPCWIHGDLHPLNVLVDGGRISAIVDFGDISAGDPANDLAVAWMMLPPAARPALRAAAGAVDDATWTRARGWALALAVTFIAGSADHAAIGAIGRETLAAVLAA